MTHSPFGLGTTLSCRPKRMSYSRFSLRLLTLLLLVPTSGWLSAQTPTQPAKFLQGEKKEVPEDFFADLEQSRLRLKLEDFGIEGAQEGLEQALVTLITPSGQRQQMRSDSQGNVEFDNVEEGVVGVVVTGPDLHATVAVYAKDQPSPTCLIQRLWLRPGPTRSGCL